MTHPSTISTIENHDHCVSLATSVVTPGCRRMCPKCHNYTGHNYTAHNCIGHNCIGHNLAKDVSEGHNHMGHDYICHHYIGYNLSKDVSEVQSEPCPEYGWHCREGAFGIVHVRETPAGGIRRRITAARGCNRALLHPRAHPCAEVGLAKQHPIEVACS